MLRGEALGRKTVEGLNVAAEVHGLNHHKAFVDS